MAPSRRRRFPAGRPGCLRREARRELPRVVEETAARAVDAGARDEAAAGIVGAAGASAEPLLVRALHASGKPTVVTMRFATSEELARSTTDDSVMGRVLEDAKVTAVPKRRSTV